MTDPVTEIVEFLCAEAEKASTAIGRQLIIAHAAAIAREFGAGAAKGERDRDEQRTEVAMQRLTTDIGDALSEVFGGRERVGSVRVVDAQEAVCRVLDRWEIPGGLSCP